MVYKKHQVGSDLIYFPILLILHLYIWFHAIVRSYALYNIGLSHVVAHLY